MSDSSSAKVQEIYHKVPPHSSEAEQGALGAILLENGALNRALEVVRTEDFYEARNRLIFEAMITLSDRGEPVDLVTITEHLRQKDKLEKAGGVAYIGSLTEAAPTARHVETYARIIKEKSLLRELISVTGEINSGAYENPSDVESFLDEAESLIFDVASNKIKPGYFTMRDLVPESISHLEKLQERSGTVTGVPSGYNDLDEITGGFQNSDLIIAAGRPGMGKTALALNILRNAAVDSEIPVAFFSLEMSRMQVTQRLFCSEARIDSSDLRHGYIPKEDWSKLMIAANVLREAKVFVDDTPSINVLEMKAKTRRLASEHNIGLVVVDYLQLMRGNQQKRDASREQEISEISRSLKALAKELEIPVVAISQLNRAVEAREDKRPRLADLRESGAIEQDADVILFLYREKKYKPETPLGNMAEVIVGKHRNGPEGVVKLTFLEEYARFESYSSIEDIPDFGD